MTCDSCGANVILTDGTGICSYCGNRIIDSKSIPKVVSTANKVIIRNRIEELSRSATVISTQIDELYTKRSTILANAENNQLITRIFIFIPAIILLSFIFNRIDNFLGTYSYVNVIGSAGFSIWFFRRPYPSIRNENLADLDTQLGTIERKRDIITDEIEELSSVQ